MEVEIVVQKGNKAFLGGFKHSKTGSEYHHAITQTVEGKKKDWNQIAEGKISTREDYIFKLIIISTLQKIFKIDDFFYICSF